MAQVFLLCPHYTISFGFCQAVHPATAGLWTVPFRRFADLIKDNQKARLNALADTCLFLCADFIDRDGPLTSDALPYGRCPQGVRRATRSAESTTAGHPRVGLACLAKMSCTSSRLSSPLVSAVSLASSKSSSLAAGHRLQ